jgi:hypothetical protein
LLVAGVNLPAAQLHVAMGIPLYRIPDIRALYGLDRFGDSPIDFSVAKPVPPRVRTHAVLTLAFPWHATVPKKQR